jgi:hypothetical protein
MRLTKQDSDIIAVALRGLAFDSVNPAGRSQSESLALEMLAARAGFLASLFDDATAATVKTGRAPE